MGARHSPERGKQQRVHGQSTEGKPRSKSAQKPNKAAQGQQAAAPAPHRGRGSPARSSLWGGGRDVMAAGTGSRGRGTAACPKTKPAHLPRGTSQPPVASWKLEQRKSPWCRGISRASPAWDSARGAVWVICPPKAPRRAFGSPDPPGRQHCPPPGSVLPWEPYVKEVGWGKGGTWGPLSFISPELKKDTIKQFF